MSALPPLNPADAALLTRFLLNHENPLALISLPTAKSNASAIDFAPAPSHDFPDLLTLLAFLARPDITPWLDHYHDLQARARLNAAANALLDVLRDTTDPTQRRLAANALLNNRTPRPQHFERPNRPEAHGSDPWASPARADMPRAPRQPHTPLDASMPSCLDAFPSSTHPTSAPVHSREPRTSRPASDNRTPSPAQETAQRPISIALDMAPTALNLNLNTDNHPIASELDVEINEELCEATDDQLDAEIDQDNAQTTDPPLSRALTGKPDTIHRFDIERTSAPPDPALVGALGRALHPAHGPSG